MTTKQLGCRAMDPAGPKGDRWFYGFVAGILTSWAAIMTVLVAVGVLAK